MEAKGRFFSIDEIERALSGDGLLWTEQDGTQYIAEKLSDEKSPGFRILVKTFSRGTVKMTVIHQ